MDYRIHAVHRPLDTCGVLHIPKDDRIIAQLNRTAIVLGSDQCPYGESTANKRFANGSPHPTRRPGHQNTPYFGHHGTHSDVRPAAQA